MAGLGRRKIQARSASRDDVRREILTSLRTGIIFSLTGVVIVLGAINGVFAVYSDFETAGIGYLAISLAAIIVAHDAYFYWTHRLMPIRACSALSTAPTIAPSRRRRLRRMPSMSRRALMMALFTPLWLLLVPMHALGLFLFMAFMIVRNVMGHAGR